MAERYSMRRDTQKHVPPHPGTHRLPAMPLGVRPERNGEDGEPDFWKEEERRHARPAPPGPPGHRHRAG